MSSDFEPDFPGVELIASAYHPTAATLLKSARNNYMIIPDDGRSAQRAENGSKGLGRLPYETERMKRERQLCLGCSKPCDFSAAKMKRCLIESGYDFSHDRHGRKKA